jgi:hypothetical protein
MTGRPDLRARLQYIGSPITPRPIKPVKPNEAFVMSRPPCR